MYPLDRSAPAWLARPLHAPALIVGPLLATLLLFAPPAFAQIAFVQSSGLFGNPAGITASSSAFPVNPKVGDTLVVLLWTWTENNAANIAVSDSAGNTYTANAAATIDQSAWFESATVYSTQVTKTASSFTVTVNMAGNDNVSQSRAVALEYSGV